MECNGGSAIPNANQFNNNIMSNKLKKFVQIEGHGDQWFWFIESEDDLCDELESNLDVKLKDAVTRQLYTDDTKTTIRPDWFYRVETVHREVVNYTEKFFRYGPLLIREIGSFMVMNNNLKFTKYIQSDRFPRDNSSCDIVVCENDFRAEEPWIEFLGKKFPGQSVTLLNLFSTRTEDELDENLNVKYITFYTTFTSYDWFENILDTIIRNNWSGKEIIGHSIGHGFCSLPDHVQGKIDQIKLLGNKLEIIKTI